MSGLAGLLAGRVPQGVYRWHAAFPPDEVRHTVEHAGRHFAHFDGWSTESKREVLEGLGQALDFPEHYGRNLDALADSLSEIDVDTVLLWDGWGPFARADERTFTTVVGILDGRAGLSVLLRGAGPEIELPSLD